MCRAERTRPRADQMLGRHVAALQDFQRRQKLLAEIIAAAADASERRGRPDHGTRAAERAVIGFDAPDRGDDGRVDAIAALHGGEGRRVLREQRAAVRDTVVAHQEVEIIPRRFGEFRLRVEQIHNVQVGRQAGGEALVILARDAAPRRIGPQTGDAIVEIGGGGADRIRRHRRIAGSAGLAAPLRRVAGAWNRAPRRGLKQAGQPVVGLVLRQRRRGKTRGEQDHGEARQQTRQKAAHEQKEVLGCSAYGVSTTVVQLGPCSCTSNR